MAFQIRNILMGKHLQIIHRSFSLGKVAMAKPTFSDITNTLSDQQPTIKLRGTKYLAGSLSTNFPETASTEVYKGFVGLKLDNSDDNGMDAIGKTLRPILDSYFDKDYVGILIKGLPITQEKDFQSFVEHLDYPNMAYTAGIALREKVEKTMYSASDEPPEFCIEPHNEMSDCATFPTKIMFCCIEPADIGGGNCVSFNREILKQLDPEVRESFRERGIRYKKSIQHENNTEYLSWQKMLNADSVQAAEELMRSQGIDWEWKANGDLVMYLDLPAFTTHPKTGEEVWFNQATTMHCTYFKSHPMYEYRQDLDPMDYPCHSCYGDDGEIEDEVLDHIRSVQWKSAMAMKLAKGDVLLLDNMLCQHSRVAFEGTRKMVVQLADSIQNYRELPWLR